MATLSQIRTKVYTLLEESSGTSHFTDSQINGFINEAVEYTAVFIEYPRAFTTQALTAGTADYTNPADSMLIRTAYYGDPTIAGDITPLKVLTEEALKQIFPNWLETTVSSRGIPAYLIQKTKTTYTIFPTPTTAAAASGKVVTLDYGQIPTAMSSDSDTPSLPTPYHSVVVFYALHLCYIVLKDPTMSKFALENFAQKVKLIQPQLTMETYEARRFTFGESSLDSDFGDYGLIP